MAKPSGGGITWNYKRYVFLAVTLQMRDVLPVERICILHDLDVRQIKRWLAQDDITPFAKAADRMIAHRRNRTLKTLLGAANIDYTVPSHSSVHFALHERWKTRGSP
jgi:hypothetical protein